VVLLRFAGEVTQIMVSQLNKSISKLGTSLYYDWFRQGLLW
jgi:hypothetical protein